MRLRLALLLFACAAAAHWGLARPTRAGLAAALDEQRQLREAARELALRLSPLERREAARERALTTLAIAPLPEGSELQVLRRSVLGALRGERVTAVKVAVRPARGDVAASLSLACEADLASVLRTVGELVKPGAGLALSRVRLSATQTGVVLDLDAVGVRRRP